MGDIDFTIILIGVFVGASAGYLGSLMVLKRMSLVGDALSHVALPGMGLALLYGINPLWGALAALFLGVIVIWSLEYKTKLPIEAIVGVVFTASLAVGVIITPEIELVEALFGDIAMVTLFDFFFAAILSVLIFFIARKISWGIILSAISEDLARSKGINTKRFNFIYLILVAVAVSLGVKVVGALLMGALVIIPAAASKNFSRNLSGYSYASMLIGAISSIAGILISEFSGFPPGPSIILVSTLIFLITLPFKE